jgi:hypothetical protein
MKFIVDLEMDGYETEEEHAKACEEFIKEQLDFSASSVTVSKHVDYQNELRTAVQYLRQGKARFSPNTTNSLVDDFLNKHKDL